MEPLNSSGLSRPPTQREFPASSQVLKVMYKDPLVTNVLMLRSQLKGFSTLVSRDQVLPLRVTSCLLKQGLLHRAAPGNIVGASVLTWGDMRRAGVRAGTGVCVQVCVQGQVWVCRCVCRWVFRYRRACRCRL